MIWLLYNSAEDTHSLSIVLIPNISLQANEQTQLSNV